MDQRSTGAMEEERRLSDRAFHGLTALLASAAYFAVFLFTGGGGAPGAAEAAIRNLVPLAIVSAAAQALISRLLIGHPRLCSWWVTSSSRRRTRCSSTGF